LKLMALRKEQIKTIIQSKVTSIDYDIEVYPKAMKAEDVAGSNTIKMLVRPITNLFVGNKHQSNEYFDIEVEATTEELLESAIEELKSVSTKTDSGYRKDADSITVNITLESYVDDADGVAAVVGTFTTINKDSPTILVGDVGPSNAIIRFNCSQLNDDIDVTSSTLYITTTGGLQIKVYIFGVDQDDMEDAPAVGSYDLTTAFENINQAAVQDVPEPLVVTTVTAEVLARTGFAYEHLAYIIQDAPAVTNFFAHGLDEAETKNSAWLPILRLVYTFGTANPFHTNFTLKNKNNMEPYQATILCEGIWAN
jgi:hypothetical protein